VRVNCVYPGLVPTEMGQRLAVDMAELGLFASPDAAVGAVIEQTPLGRLGEVADMADVVVFLASDQARFVTGIGLPNTQVHIRPGGAFALSLDWLEAEVRALAGRASGGAT
jgi:NAD(P)-dependent dehydrogenase (short-subunit alcohol dehydrogenase family)